MLAPTFYSILTEDEKLTGFLPDYEFANGDTLPAVFQNYAQRGTDFPHIVFRLQETESNHWNKEEYRLYIDVWDFQESATTTQTKKIARRIKNLIHKLKINEADGYKSIRCKLRSKGLIEEDKDYIVRYELEFYVWAWDKQFVEESENV